MVVCMPVCNRFTIEIYGFMHSFVPFWHMLLKIPSRLMPRTGIEDDSRLENKSRDIDDS